MFYFARTPKWLKILYKERIWEMPGDKKVIYLTFDDGPHPEITTFILNELKKYNAKATFFCIGKNVLAHPEIYRRIGEEGHAVGNHTHHHLNGWKTNNQDYVADILKATRVIQSDLFRPPYGRMKRSQEKAIAALESSFKIIMWSVLSGDFDPAISPEKCCKNVIRYATNGSIVVFHDSIKARTKINYALPLVLQYFSRKGYFFEKIGENSIQRVY